jgi:hypothetical protein
MEDEKHKTFAPDPSTFERSESVSGRVHEENVFSLVIKWQRGSVGRYGGRIDRLGFIHDGFTVDVLNPETVGRSPRMARPLARHLACRVCTRRSLGGCLPHIGSTLPRAPTSLHWFPRPRTPPLPFSTSQLSPLDSPRFEVANVTGGDAVTVWLHDELGSCEVATGEEAKPSGVTGWVHDMFLTF